MKASLIRRLIAAPYYVRAWFTVASAAEGEDWQEIVRVLSPFDDRGLANNESRHWLGCALACLGRWDDAISQFEKIDGAIKDRESDARRIYNHAYALAKVDRIDEALCLLDDADTSGWPPSTERKGRDLLAHLRDGSVGDCRVLH